MCLTANIFDRNWGSHSCREGRVITRARALVLQSLGTAGRDNHFHSRLFFLTTAPNVVLIRNTRSMLRGLGLRIHCGVEVTESSTNKQHIIILKSKDVLRSFRTCSTHHNRSISTVLSAARRQRRHGVLRDEQLRGLVAR